VTDPSPPAPRPKLLIIGATGLFGGHLARQLIAADRWDVVLVARDARRLADFSRDAGGRTLVLDRADHGAVTRALAHEKPFAVIDTAGPFQQYGSDGYALARAAIRHGAHYLDIADAAEFVAGIESLDAEATAAGVTVLSGASSTPALAAAAADRLVDGLVSVDSVEGAIVPGNRTPRGRSVTEAILGQVGKPMRVWRDGRWQTAWGWSDARTIALGGTPALKPRRAVLVDTPDRLLFPDRYKARTVAFRAGLELSFMQRALEAAHWILRLGLAASLLPLSGIAYRAAGWLAGFGSDRGGMQVRVVGSQADGTREERTWSMVIGDGQGPKVPVQPVVVLLDKLRAGGVAAGARPAVGEVTLGEMEAALALIGASTSTQNRPWTGLFPNAVGNRFASLPQAVRDLHSGYGENTYEGTAECDGPDGLLAWCAARLVGLPPAGATTTVRVTIDASEHREVWTRRFGRHTMRSTLTPGAAPGEIRERFGALSFAIALHVEDGTLHYPVRAGRAFGGIPLPRWLLPVSITRESVDADGRFTFDVQLLLPRGHRIAHYRGSLAPAATA